MLSCITPPRTLPQQVKIKIFPFATLSTFVPVVSALLFFPLLCLLVSPVSADESYDHTQDSIKEYGYQVVNVYPHDPKAFTQGLIFKDGYLYESTGLFGRSSLRKVELETGKVLQKISIDRKYFAEGLASNKKQLIQLSWKAGQGFIYDQDHFQLKKTFNYPGDGWGLTFNNDHFIMSDGSSFLRILDEKNLQETHRTQVLKKDQAVKYLNELEMVKGNIFANIWQTDSIFIISPSSGKVVGQIDLGGLLQNNPDDPKRGVLNGIAYDAEGDRLFITGKLWPKLFEIRLIPKPKPLVEQTR